ncbi:MAG: hypothetical protein ACOY3L_01255 [Pseudomonadota bacterium]
MTQLTPRFRLPRSLAAPLLALALGACAALGPEGPSTPPAACPENLSGVRDRLVTPYDQLASFIGPDELESTLTKPIDAMIERGGGFAPSIASGENYVKEYRDILDHEADTRAEYRALGKDDAWIDLYLSSVRDGITINQAFVDAVRCKQAAAQAQG